MIFERKTGTAHYFEDEIPINVYLSQKSDT